MNETNRVLREHINERNRKRLDNHGFSIIASNCNGAFITRDLGEPYNSPFVNLWLFPKDFIRYCRDMARYNKTALRFIETDRDYPVAQLDDIVIYFMHYDSEQTARKQWIKRMERIDYDNLFLLMTERDGCTSEDLRAFDNLPYRKAVFTHIPHPEIESAHYIPGFENENELGHVWQFLSPSSGEKHYDSFDYVAWLNGEVNKE